jgi:hypothetical protein
LYYGIFKRFYLLALVYQALVAIENIVIGDCYRVLEFFLFSLGALGGAR